MSQLLLRLRDKLSKTSDPSQTVELSALIASNLARMGRFGEARQTIAEVRAGFPGGNGGIGTLWIMLAEGLIYLFQDQSPQALDRVARAQMLAVALRQPKLIALSSAWKAHIEFENSDFAAMVGSLHAAKAQADSADHDSRSRMAVVLNNAFIVCGHRAGAKKWFSVAHYHAVTNGDQATIDALIYNKAALELARMRVENCVSHLDPLALRSLRTEVYSSANFTSLARVTALSNHWNLIEARLLILEGRHELAIDKLSSTRQQGPFAKNHFSQRYADLELCFCNFQLGRVETESVFLSGDVEPGFRALDLDEKIVWIWMLWRMALSNSRFGDPDLLKEELDSRLAEHQLLREELEKNLQPFID